MADSPLFKRAFVHGINSELTRLGVVHYPSKEASDYSADYIADNINMPDPHTAPEKVTAKVAEHICENLVKAAQYQCAQAGNKYSPQLTKAAQAASPVSLAADAAWAIMEKCAAETGSLIDGGDVPNDMPAAASDNGEAALEQDRRPENYANMGEGGVGNYERKGEGSVGTEEAHPEKPKATDEGSNSVTENTAKHGTDLSALVDAISKTAGMGSLIDPGSNPNDMPAAAKNNGEAALEQARRPENYANKGEKGVGKSDMVPTPAAFVGHEQDHPEAPKATDSGSNVVTEHTTKKSAFDEMFEAAAKQVVPFLPEKMASADKVKHVRAVLGLETEKRAAYLADLYVHFGAEKTAAENVRIEFIKRAAEDEDCDDKDDADKDDKPKADGDDGKKMPPWLAGKGDDKKDEEAKEASVATPTPEPQAQPLSALQTALAQVSA